MTLIIIDGLDAAGKTTQATNLCKVLMHKTKTVLLRIHPTNDNFFGAKAKQFLYRRGKNAHFAAAFFYMIDVIRSILLYSWRKYDYIIFVRYLMGTAYLPPPAHRIAYNFFACTVPTSDFMFFLDVPPKEAENRIRKSRSQLEMFENLQELQKTRRKALSLAEAGKWRIIDAGKSVKDVESEIMSVLQPLF